MRGVIIEPYEAGHRAVYVRWIASALLNAGVDVAVVGGPGLIRHPELADLSAESRVRAPRAKRGTFAGIEAELPTAGLNRAGTVGLGRFQLRMRRWIGAAYLLAQPMPKRDTVIVPYLDYCFHAFATLGSPFGVTPWCGITMRTEFSQIQDRENMRLLMRHLLLRRILAQRTARAIFSIDPRCQSAANRDICETHGDKLRYLADPAERPLTPSREISRAELKVPANSKVLLLFGSIDLRKGLAEMLSAVAATPDPREWTVVVAGKQTADAVQWLDQWRNTSDASRIALTVVDGLIAKADVPRLFACADVVWVGYPGHHAMSGVLVQAALAGKPLLAQSGSLVGDLVTEAGIGIACDVRNADATAIALATLLEPRLVDAARVNGPVRFAAHTPEAFGSKILEVVARTASREAA